MVAPTGFEPATSALRGRRPKPLDDGATLAGVEGVEPSHTAPETAVLPLDDTPVTQARVRILKARKQAVKDNFEQSGNCLNAPAAARLERACGRAGRLGRARGAATGQSGRTDTLATDYPKRARARGSPTRTGMRQGRNCELGCGCGRCEPRPKECTRTVLSSPYRRSSIFLQLWVVRQLLSRSHPRFSHIAKGMVSVR